MSTHDPRRKLVRLVSIFLIAVTLLAGLPLLPSAPAITEVAAQQSGACLGWTSGGATYTTRRMQYTSDGILHLVGCNETFTLSQILTALQGNTIVGSEPADALQLVDPAQKIWMLNVKLQVEEGATLNLVGGSGDVNWLRLKSGPSVGIIFIKAINSTLLIQNTRVSSWDPTTGTFDYTDHGVPGSGGGTKARSFIAARSNLDGGRAWTAPTSCSVNGGNQDYYEARMDIIGSTVDHLGYYAAEAYGLSWKVYSKDTSISPPNSRELFNRADVFGTISNSTFTENFFGGYTFGAYCMQVSGNNYTGNYYYGFDPHDDSDFITVTNNTFNSNGGHGFICSVYCGNLVVTNNTANGNDKNGFMIHRRVDGARIEGNTANNNGDSGLAIFDSYAAIVRGNRFENNGIAGIRFSVGSSDNLIENNTLTGANSSGGGHPLYSFAGGDLPTQGGSNRISRNVIRGNTITGLRSPVIKLSDATDNVLENNTITADGSLTTYEFRDGIGNILRDNTVYAKTIVSTYRSSSGQPVATTKLENLPLNRDMEVKHSSTGAGTTSFADTRSYVLRGTGTTARSTGTSANLTAISTTITPVELAVVPASNSVTVNVTTWQTSGQLAKAWTESASSSPGNVTHTVGSLQAGTCYEVTVNGAPFTAQVAAGSGVNARISFGFNGAYSGTLNFAVAASTTACSGLPTSTATAASTSSATATATMGPTGTATQTSTATAIVPATATPTATMMPTTTATATPATVAFADGFESGTMSAWTNVSGITVQSSVVYSGANAARAVGSGTTASAQRALAEPRTELYYRIRFNIQSKSTIAYLLRFRTATNGDILGVNVSSSGKLSVYNRSTATTTASSLVVSNGVWHELQVHLNQATGQLELWYDGALVNQLSMTTNLGTNPIGRIELGEPSTGRTFNIVFDDVAINTSFIPSGIGPAPTATATRTPIAAASSTPSPIHTSTSTPAPAPSSTDTPVAVATNTRVATASNTPVATATSTEAPTATSTVAAPSPVAFSDNFESGTMGKWSTVSGISVQSSVTYAGSFAARATGAGTRSYAQRTFDSPQTELYYRVRFRIASKSTIAYLIRFRTATNGDILGVNVSSSGRLAVYNRSTATTTTSSIVVSNGVWHELQVHVDQTTGQLEVWYDGALVNQLSMTTNLGTSAIGRIELGEPSTGRTFDIAFDDVRVDGGFVSSSFVAAAAPTATPTLTATPAPTDTPVVEPTAAPTDTPAPTEIPVETATAAPTETPLPPEAPTETPAAEQPGEPPEPTGDED